MVGLQSVGTIKLIFIEQSRTRHKRAARQTCRMARIRIVKRQAPAGFSFIEGAFPPKDLQRRR
jgi:hypothetical protein